MIRATLLAAACATALAGCTTVQNNPNATGGALLGAIGGAAAGTLVGGDDRRNALVGAGIGLLAGAAVGSYLDNQERQLQQQLQGSGANVYRQGDALYVLLPGGVTFATGSAVIQPAFYRPLDQIAGTLQQYNQSFVDVIGHTDSQGSDQTNLQLSERRAEAVANYLRSRGVHAGRLAAFGMGESQPIATNATDIGRSQNRRVEIKIIPATQG